MAITVQVIATIFICFSCSNMGILISWPSSTILLFKSGNTTLNRPMGTAEVSLFSSLPAIGSLIANPIAGVLLDRLGRKKSMILSSLMLVMAWSIIVLTSQVEVVLTAMFVGGLGSAMYLLSTVYISEICQDSIRGAVTSVPMQFNTCGALISYLMGGYLTYYQMVYSCQALAVIGFVVLLILKDTPLIFMAKGQEEEAAKSIAFYRSKKPTSKKVLQELDKLRRTLNSHSEVVQSLTTVEDTPTNEVTKKKTCWQFFKNSPATQREFVVVMMLMLNTIWTGIPAVLSYAEPIFEETLPPDSLSPNLCSVMMGAVMVISGLIAAFLIDRVGRRPLIIYSSIIVGLCCIVLGTQILTEWGPKWTVPLFMYIYVIFITIGPSSVPFVAMGELFTPEVKSILSMIAMEWFWILKFLILFVFNLLADSVGLPPVFYFFSFIGFSTAVFFFYCMPETKGLPVYDIQELYTKKSDFVTS